MPPKPHVHHTLKVDTQLGPLHLDVNLELTAPWTLLFGPSGSGKSTLLRAACGLLEIPGITFTRHAANTAPTHLQNTPTHHRHLSWAPQRSSLFPHLTVRENIEFSPRSSGLTPDITEALYLLRLQPLASRLPRDLSGGERQRVNLARAFAAPRCRLMLLDEPFAGIDRTLRDELLPAMRTWLADRGIPVLSVSHDVDEALQLQAEVVLLCNGKAETQGPAATVLEAERERLLRNLLSHLPNGRSQS